MPTGLVLRGGEYFYKERQTTDPSIRIDNTSSRPANENTDTGPPTQTDQDNGEQELKPINRVTEETEVKPINRKPAADNDLNDLF